MGRFFGFIKLLLGLSLILLVISSILFLNFFGNNIVNNFRLGNTENNTEALGTLYLMNFFTLSLISAGFGILFLIFGIILIINGILDLKGE